MTIIKVTKDGKVLEKKKADDTMVMLEPEIREPAARTLHISAMPSARSKRIVNIFLLIIALLVLSVGVIGGVYIYRYMQNRHQAAQVSVQYSDPAYQDTQALSQQRKYVGMITEDVDIEVERQVERITVPQFDECRQSIVMHDFLLNYTVIVDTEDRECFIMDLDRTQMSPPKTFAEFLRKYVSGYYMPKVDVVRRDYRVVYPPLKDLKFAGKAIAMECSHFKTYRLEKKEPVAIFELTIEIHSMKSYGYSDLQHVIKDRVFK